MACVVLRSWRWQHLGGHSTAGQFTSSERLPQVSPTPIAVARNGTNLPSFDLSEPLAAAEDSVSRSSGLGMKIVRDGDYPSDAGG